MKKLLLLVTFLAFTGLTFAGTTGGLVGKVTTEDGTGLPGVTIIAKSPALQGQKSTTTDANGKYRLILLPPGVYDITFSMPSFQTITRKNIKVMLDNNLTLNQVMKADKLEESIVVTAEQPLIDSTTSSVGQNYSSEYVESIPTQRNYLSVVNMTPGVNGSDISGGMRMSGASGTESNYIIDGLSTTDLENGTNGKGLNFDFVEEVQVKTGGFEAEYGRSTGGIVNVITKSGGNEFEGSVFYYFRNASFSATEKGSTASVTPFLGTKEYDYGFSLGGPIIKDKLWFFIAYNPSVIENSYQVNPALADYRTSTVSTDKTERDYWALKLTYNINENNTLVLSTFSDPSTVTDYSANGTEDVATKGDHGGTDWTLKYDSILSESLVFSAQIGSHYQEIKEHALSDNAGSMVINYFAYPNSIYKGGPGYLEDTEMTRDVYKASIEWFYGNHDIKAGFDYHDNNYVSGRQYSGGAYYYYLDFGSAVYLIRRMFAHEDPNGNLSYGDQNYSQNMGFYYNDTTTKNTAWYVQDKWNVTDNFMLSVGFRLETQEVNGFWEGSSYTAMDIETDPAPRIGFTWDIFGDGTSKFYANYGEYYENIPMDINNRAFASEVFYWDYWWIDKATIGEFWDFDPNSYSFDHNSGDFLRTRVSGIGGTAPVSSNIDAGSVEEFLLGYDYLINDTWSLGVKFMYRSIGDVIEDISFDFGNTYIIANPGRDIIFTTNTDLEWVDALGNVRTYSAGDEVYVTAEESGFSKPVRNYRTYELSLKRKMVDNFSMNFSYMYSELWGDYIGGVLPYYGQTDAHITAMYDLPTTLVNSGGYLPADRPHNIKIDGVYAFDNGVNVGFFYNYRSGTPITAYLDVDASSYIYGEFKLLPSGKGTGRTMATQTLDLNISYTYDLGKYGSLTGYFYMFNVFNWQNQTAVDQEFARIADDDTFNAWVLSTFPGVNDTDSYAKLAAFVDGRFGSLQEAAAWVSETPGLRLNWDPTGQDETMTFGESLGYQTPRYIRFGLKWKF